LVAQEVEPPPRLKQPCCFARYPAAGFTRTATDAAFYGAGLAKGWGKMRRLLRNAVIGFAAVLAFTVLAGAFPVSAGTGRPPVTIIVRKVIIGSATEGSTIWAACEGAEGFMRGDLRFDASGLPVPGAGGLLHNTGDAWVITSGNSSGAGFTCAFTETTTGGATSTTWTCAFDADFGTPADTLGCQTDSGSGTETATIVYGGVIHQPVFQTGEAVFTNTYGPTRLRPISRAEWQQEPFATVQQSRA
jgi:hypothetical protein